MKYYFAFLLVVLNSNTFASIKLLDNTAKSSSLNWNIVNDTVMGGRSSSRWISNTPLTSSFEGFLSLQNNGGFASIRQDLKNIDLTNTQGIYLKVKGDGRKYKFRIRSQASARANYSYEFQTVKGKDQTFYLPYKDFKAAWRGRSLRNLPILAGKDVREIGFFLGDKVQGEFKLEVSEIVATTQKAYSNTVTNNLINNSKLSEQNKKNKEFDPMTIDPCQ